MEISTWLYVKSMGPMLSYLAAQDCLYKHGGADAGGAEFHAHAFSSRRTRAWDILVDKVEPRVFWRGDECSPFIACANLLAFLTGARPEAAATPRGRPRRLTACRVQAAKDGLKGLCQVRRLRGGRTVRVQLLRVVQVLQPLRDSTHIHDHDVFVCAGPESERIGGYYSTCRASRSCPASN